MAVALFRLLGWHWEFLPSSIAKLVPGIDLVPLWTLAVANVNNRRSEGEQHLEIQMRVGMAYFAVNCGIDVAVGRRMGSRVEWCTRNAWERGVNVGCKSARPGVTVSRAGTLCDQGQSGSIGRALGV